VEHIYDGFSIASRGVSLLYKARLAQLKPYHRRRAPIKNRRNVLMSNVKTVFSGAVDSVGTAVMDIVPTSNTSKYAKAMVLMLMFALLAPMSVQAAAFITEAIDILGVVIIAIGGGLGIWGVVNLLEGYGNDNPGAKSQGIKQLMAGLGLILLGLFAIPQLETLLPV